MFLRDLPSENSIKCGKIYIPTKALANHLVHIVRPVFLELEEVIGSLGVSGSASLVNIDGEFFICLTRHQLQVSSSGVPESSMLDTVRIARITDNSRLENILFNRLYYCESSTGEEYEDIIVLKALNQNLDGNPDSPFFFPLRNSLSPKAKYISSIAVGYPLEPIEMSYVSEVEKHGDVKLYPAVIDAKRCDVNTLKGKFMTSYRKSFNPNIPMNGFSGGAIFDCFHDTDGFHCLFAGVIIRGGKERLHIIEAEYLLELTK